VNDFLTLPTLAAGPIAADVGPGLLSSFVVGSMSEGVSIAIAGLTIVFLALLLISLFIASLPRVLKFVAQIWPEVEERHSAEASGEVYPESLVPEDGVSLAAIGFVLHVELQKQLAAEQASKGKG
jgi:Na+-transporting methylmalonyl-CoA/oxaloacetate decarboxylase gamma subunit